MYIKGIVHPQIELFLYSFGIYPVWLYFFCGTQMKIYWRVLFSIMVAVKLQKKHSTEERKSYGFWTTWGWVNDDRILISFVWWANPSKYIDRVLAECCSVTDELQASGRALGPHMRGTSWGCWSRDDSRGTRAEEQRMHY